jgi:uncharacterized membrane protein
VVTNGSNNSYLLDDLHYTYYNQDLSEYNPTAPDNGQHTNKLAFVTNGAELYTGVENFPTQLTQNYRYDAIGNLVHDAAEAVDITWNIQGKITSVIPTDAGDDPILLFTYDASGNRSSKTVKPRVAGVVQHQDQWQTTHYVRDASGEVMAVYEVSYQAIPELINSFYQELYLIE